MQPPVPESDKAPQPDSAPPVAQSAGAKATAAIGSRRVHWFIDDVWYASCSADTGIFYVPEKGIHNLLCVDDFGRSSEITFEVK